MQRPIWAALSCAVLTIGLVGGGASVAFADPSAPTDQAAGQDAAPAPEATVPATDDATKTPTSAVVKDTASACVSDPAISFTWSGAAGSEATITVAGSAGTPICDPLYVGAAGWTYDQAGTSNNYPQTLAAFDLLTVDKTGIYHAAIPTECGQRDMYASTSSEQLAAFRVGATKLSSGNVTGPGAGTEPHFLSQYATGGVDYASEQSTSCVAPPTCVQDPTITYTWDGAAGSTGTIIVSDKNGAKDGDALCAPVYVGAAGWSYDDPGKQYPQTLRGYQTLTLDKIGTYHFTTPQVCGQRDVYASPEKDQLFAFEVGKTFLNSGAVTGSGAGSEPKFLSDYATGVKSPSYANDGFDSCTTPPVPTKDASGAVSVTPGTCDAPGTFVWGTPANATVEEGSTPDGTQGPADYSVKLVANEGHVFAGGQSTLTLTGVIPGKSTDASCTQLPTLPLPPTTPAAVTPVKPATPATQLAYTGASDQSGDFAGAAAALLLLGGAIVVADVRRRRHQQA